MGLVIVREEMIISRKVLKDEFYLLRLESVFTKFRAVSYTI